MNARRVVFRADGGAAIGLGHVTRCLALAEQLRGMGVECFFLTASTEAKVLDRIAAAGCRVERVHAEPGTPADAEALAARARALGAAVVADSYAFGSDFQAKVKDAGVRMLVIDDLARGHFTCDLVLNQSAGAEALRYSREPYTRLLLGSAYALLRPAFVGRTAVPVVEPRVLLMMGGSDPDRRTLQVLGALRRCTGAFSIDVVAGPSFGTLDELNSAAAGAERSVRIHSDPSNLPALMGAATLAVSAAGSTCWELAHLGVPAILLVLADNQRANATGLSDRGFAVNLGDADTLAEVDLVAAIDGLLADPSRRGNMAQAGRAIVDGEGARRAAEALLSS